MRQTALCALLAGTIDYAGLFPPAALPLETTVRNYLRYRTEPDSWMLGRLIVPTAKFNELAALLPTDGPPVALSALGRGGPDAGGFATGYEADLQAIHAFVARHESRVEISVLETKPPTSAPVPSSESPGVSPFFEVTLGDTWRDNLAFIEAVSPRGVKLRCGGLEASAFPSIEQVSGVLQRAASAGARIKFTAGLHHPVRRFDRSVDTKMHGFLNVYAAGLLAARGESESALIEVLGEEDPAAFSAGDVFRCRDHVFTIDEIVRARKQLTSFGSCSFDEPRDDLRAMGLL